MDIRSDGISDDVRGVVDYSESALLEFWFEGDAECESSHEGMAECSGLVVARCVPSCGLFSVLWCAVRVAGHWGDVVRGCFVCRGCGVPIDDCWRVVPV